MSFALTKRTYGDSVDRVIWRSKQVIDYAFVYAAVKSQSEYHLALEDDVIVSRQFITAIQDFVELKKNEKWIALDFAKFYSIGILFHSLELPKIVKHLLLFYQDEPVDGLLRSYIGITVSYAMSVNTKLLTFKIMENYMNLGKPRFNLLSKPTRALSYF